jgi:hypothetical protein
MNDYDYGAKQLCATSQGIPLGYTPPTIAENLAEQKKGLETRLARVNNAIALLNKYPEIYEFMDTFEKLKY